MKRNQKESKRKFFGIISGMTEKTTGNDQKRPQMTAKTIFGSSASGNGFLDFPCIFPEISIKFLIFASFFILIE